MTLSQKVKELRISAGSSQEELASATQLSLRTIQRIESGETQPRGDSLKRLAQALGVATEELTRAPASEVPLPLPDDKGFLVVLHLSALSFLLFPFLPLFSFMGIMAPLVLWLLKKDKIKGVRETGRKILNFQISWFLVFALVYGYVFTCKLNHIAVFMDQVTMFRILVGLCLFNVISIVINLFRHLRSLS
jgi:transcriptional regulator with XRE-family HTH domain